MAVGSTGLKVLQTFLYSLALLCSAVILIIYSYFLAIQAKHHADIPNNHRAIEGIGGLALLYTIFAVILTCCLGGITFFAFVGIVLDVLFGAAFIAVAAMTKDGTSCSGKEVNSPYGSGPADSHKGRGNIQYGISLRTACNMNSAVLAVAIIGIFLFFISAFVQLWLGRRHQRDKRYGPSPANDYTSGSGIKWFKRRRGARSAHAAAVKEATGPGEFPSQHVTTLASDNDHQIGYLAPAEPVSYTNNGVGHAPPHHAGVPPAGGYHTGPVGSAVNPYGYDNSQQVRSHPNF